MDLPVVVEKLVFRNDKGFCILACSLNPYSAKYKPELEDVITQNVKRNSYNNFTITASMLDAHEKMEGRQYVFTGKFVKHEKFGDQFKADFGYQDQPTTNEGMESYLQTLPNIGPVRAAEMIKKFGIAEINRIMDEEPKKLMEINGITEARVPPIKQAWDRENSLRELYMWLNDHGINPKLAKKIYDTWGLDSFRVLTHDPYKLTEIKGIGFIRADQIAHKIFIEVPKDIRTVACMRSVLEDNLRHNSNLCMPYNAFTLATMEDLREGSEQNDPTHQFDEKGYKKLIPECIKKNLNVFVAVKNLVAEGNLVFVYLKVIWEKEKYIAKSIYDRGREIEQDETEQKDNPNAQPEYNRFECDDEDLVEAEKDASEFSGRQIKLDEYQKVAIKSVFDNNISVITGGAGTGKSTICRCICYLGEEKGLSVRNMSPTGKAARVLSEKTGMTAETIHRSLKMKPDDDLPREEITNDIVIIDEFSMVGVDTMYAVMVALKQNPLAHIVIVGDPNQLPSVSPGCFLKDVIESRCANVVKLDKIHRQDENSFIPVLAHDISIGRVVEVPENATDIKWYNLTAAETFDITLRKVVKAFVRENSIDDLQVIAPMYKGMYGINRTNEIMQDLASEINNTKGTAFVRGFSTIYVGDRMIQLENNYDKEIFNGDMGKVVDVGRKALNPNVSNEQKDYVVVNFYGNNLTYVGDEIDQLRLAYCCSIHKFQGSQSPYVLFILPSEASIMASKELVYTAMTRASKRLDIYGHMNIFRLAPTKSTIKLRYTNMNNIIKEFRENSKILRILE